MKFYKPFILMLLLTSLMSCDEEVQDPNAFFDITFAEVKKTYKTQDEVSVSINNKKNKTIESVSYKLDGNPVGSSATAKIPLQGEKMGIRTIKATITADGSSYTISKEFTITATERPVLYTYKILDSYPHDVNAFTQGLEFEDDTLYESTGQRKNSYLRKTDYKKGTVLQEVKLADQYFGEGLTILNDKIYQLTWQANTGFIYDYTTLEKTGSFVYNSSKEGWGLCNDGKNIYKSDGTQKIWTLNPNTLAEESYIEIYTDKGVVDNVNELEWVDGKIYANIFQKGAVAVVNPSNGAVEGVIDLNGLKDEVTQHEKLDVLNGIAYNGEPNILYVTGNNWDQLFKVEIIKK